MIVALDLETTGVDSKNDQILEVALVKFNEETFEIIETFSTLINPGIPIPEVVSNITNIFDNDVKDAPILDVHLKQKIRDFIGNFPILGHNTSFDRDFLVYNGIDVSQNYMYDTFMLSNIVFFDEKSLNLGNLCERFGIHLKDAHRALDDTFATIGLFQHIFQHIERLSQEKKDILNFIFARIDFPAFEGYRQLFGFSKDILSEEKMQTLLLNIISKYQTPSIDEDENDVFSFKQEDIERIFGSLPNAELRENQLLLSQKIFELLFDEKKIVIEAPTGVGKTFGYLIPSLLKSLQSKEQVIISTHTKALQDQIFYKDLAFLSENLDMKFSYAKLKGKKNYIAVFRFLEYIFGNNKFSIEEGVLLSKISLWLFETKSGELDELNFYPQEYNILRYLHADHFYVLSDGNEYKLYEYLFKARTQSSLANIVIVNHSLLIQDMTSSSSLFGQIKNLIVDEAHNLEDTATDAFTKSFTLESLKEIFDKIKNTLKKSNSIVDNFDIKSENIISQVELVFDLYYDYIIHKNTFGNEYFQGWIQKDFFLQNENIGNIVKNIEIYGIEISNVLQTLPDKIFNSIKNDISGLEECIEIIKICGNIDSKDVFIPMFSYGKNTLRTLSYTVLNPGIFLEQSVWNKIPSIGITSATLQIQNTFSYISGILHLQDFETFVLKSDFDYARQVLLYIPNDLGSIKYNNTRIHNFMLEFLKIVKGRTLVLLTSFNAIRDLYLNLNLPLKQLGTHVLPQGIGGSKHKIANYFKMHAENSVILGTDSFWEGVDIPGEDLKYLFIHKFPFSVPNDPIFQARSALYTDAFREYSIPKAIIKTKQGFGRLIRTKQDTGIVILLDDRYFSTSWGALMRASFPDDINIKLGSSLSFIELLKTKFTKSKV